MNLCIAKKQNLETNLVDKFNTSKKAEKILGGEEVGLELPVSLLERLYQDMNIVWGFIENSGKGFLSQDLTKGFLNNMNRMLKENKSLTEVLDSLQANLISEKIPIPQNGIPDPEIENQYSLFLR